MNTQATQSLQRTSLDEQAVADYLRTNPGFFAVHGELLTELELPHPSGTAISLVERQVSALREQNQRLKQQLQTLIHNARSNEILGRRMHYLTLHLLECDTVDGLFETLRDKLRNDFDADAVTLCLMKTIAAFTPPNATRDGLLVRYGTEEEMERFDKLLQGDHTVCGRLTQRQMEYLFGDRAAGIASVALTPLKARDPGAAGSCVPLGVLGIGSHDTHRFQPGMGTIFLNQMADIIAAMLTPWLE